jgi:hypothetical protein
MNSRKYGGRPRKFTDSQADEIRRRYLNGESARSLATEFNTHFSYITRIAKGEIYRTTMDGKPMPTYKPSGKVHKLFKPISRQEASKHIG